MIAMLAGHPGIRYAVVTDADSDPESVFLAVAIRSAMPDAAVMSCELRIPRARYDPFLLLNLIHRHGGTVH